eukprot:CAMPEP_0201654474 /NCGR_PEP_ID=MMETSP0493-20130528/45519_1 /ASSEMBLY_ACC=CAM_ASM_000838 /TAXON_ID=420259 /ORGANISM="Thalassiosira gravida, Strain GMp14c1" /LENGTH=218 /DNA_ID=CAMNT_0048131035 /DNA_START=696 /DNA_END=1351 /DNA_ORIENTATION=-
MHETIKAILDSNPARSVKQLGFKLSAANEKLAAKDVEITSAKAEIAHLKSKSSRRSIVATSKANASKDAELARLTAENASIEMLSTTIASPNNPEYIGEQDEEIAFLKDRERRHLVHGRLRSGKDDIDSTATAAIADSTTSASPKLASSNPMVDTVDLSHSYSEEGEERTSINTRNKPYRRTSTNTAEGTSTGDDNPCSIGNMEKEDDSYNVYCHGPF